MSISGGKVNETLMAKANQLQEPTHLILNAGVHKWLPYTGRGISHISLYMTWSLLVLMFCFCFNFSSVTSDGGQAVFH